MSATRDAYIASIVAHLNAIDGSDPERAHSEADELLLAAADVRIAEAYEAVIKRCSWWAAA